MKAADVFQTLKAQAQQIMSESQFVAWSASAAHFHKYSYRNRCIIAGAGFGTSPKVNSYKRWQTVGRQVRKGEKAIWILAPTKRKDPDAEAGTGPRPGEKEVRDRVYFIMVPVFAYEQTDPREDYEGEPWKPLEAPSMEGDAAELVSRLDAAISARYLLNYRTAKTAEVQGANGWYQPSLGAITVLNDRPGQAVAHTMLHELAHAMHHSQSPQFGQDYSRDELIAECTAYAVGTANGLQSLDHSAAYALYYGIALEQTPEALAVFHKELADIIAMVSASIAIDEDPEQEDRAA